ncbi:MAG: hypothetical protein REDVDVYQ_000336 [Candidatus Fervidibacter sp.]
MSEAAKSITMTLTREVGSVRKFAVKGFSGSKETLAGVSRRKSVEGKPPQGSVTQKALGATLSCQRIKSDHAPCQPQTQAGNRNVKVPALIRNAKMMRHSLLRMSQNKTNGR